jgi:hypothetical protein
MNQTEATGENDPRDKEHSDCLDASPRQEPSDAPAAASDLVPDDFDLGTAKRASSTTPRDEQKRCPECKSTSIMRKVGGPSSTAKAGGWRCNECAHHFETPLEPDVDRDRLATDGGREQCVVCAHTYDREEHDQCPNCQNATLGDFDDDDDDPLAGAVLATDGGYDVDGEPRDDPRSLTSRLSNAITQLERGLEDVAADDEWTAQAVASIIADCRELRLIVDGDEKPSVATDGGRPQGRRAYRAEAHDAIADAGVGDQAPGGGCPHSDDALPCLECLFNEDGGER